MDRKINILLAEDEENMGNMLCEYLNVKGYQTDLFPDGEKALIGFCAKKYDICLLDVMMPKKDGFTLAKEIRQVNPAIPIIFLTAKSMKEDIKQGFSVGADDYIIKPFSIEELQLRIEAILRRTRLYQDTNDTGEFKVGKYVFYYTKQILELGKASIKLTSKESELLHLLCLNMNGILERSFALCTIWQDDSYFNARSMDVYITKLRKYLKKDPDVQIVNVRGRGFKLIVS